MPVATCLLLQPRPLPRAAPPPHACVVLASSPRPQRLRNAPWRRAPASELSPAHRALRHVLWPATRSAARPASSRRSRAVEASAGAAAGAPVTVWVKRMDVPGAQYVSVKGVDLQQTVDDFKARWVAQAKLDLDPSLVTLRLVACGPRKPSAAEEEAAAVLDDPSLSLADVGITGTAWLLAYVESSSPLSSASAAACSLALHDFEVAVLQKIEYDAALTAAFDPTQTVPRYVTLPQHPSLRFSTRRRFPLEGDNFTFMRRTQSREIADMLLDQLKKKEFATYIQGPQGVGKSHMLYEAALLLSTSPGCRVVYEHDCASWANLDGLPVKGTLYFVRLVAMAFAGDHEVLELCKEFTSKIAVMSSSTEAQDALCSVFLPQLGDLCKRLGLQVFFIFDQHNSLTPKMRSSFPFSLPESGLLRVSQLRGVAMVVISASANNEYQLEVASQQPPWPQVFVNRGFLTAEMDVFLKHHGLFGASEAELDSLRYETNCYPLELAYFLEVRALLKKAKLDSFESIMDAYLNGSETPLVEGRRSYFAGLVRRFDVYLSGRPDADRALEHLVNGVVCMKLELPLSTFLGQVLLNLQMCFKSSAPHRGSTTASRRLDYISPITPAALSAAADFYLADSNARTKLDSAFRYVFESPTLETSIRGLMLQRYLIQQLENANGFTLSAGQYNSDHELGSFSKVLSVARRMRKVEWNGNTIPQTTLSRSEDLLLVPLSQTYPGVDFLIWVAQTKTLCLFQVTLSSLSQHSSNFWESRSDLQSSWSDFLGVRRFDRVWITLDVDAGKAGRARSHEGQCACSLADLVNNNETLFPLLRSWSPASQVTGAVLSSADVVSD